MIIHVLHVKTTVQIRDELMNLFTLALQQHYDLLSVKVKFDDSVYLSHR